MKRIVILSALTLSLLGGVASADRHRGGHWNRHAIVATAAACGGAAASRVTRRRSRAYRTAPRRRRIATRVVRRPIFVQRPVVNVRYYNYHRRPAVLVENYAAMDGYFWVAGSWSWNGYEWTGPRATTSRIRTTSTQYYGDYDG